jgi:hypothetical protein
MKFNMTHVLLVFREILVLVSKKAFFKKIVRVSILCAPGLSLSVKGVSILMLKAVLTWQHVSLSTTCSMNVQGVSYSTTNSIVVKGVSILMPKIVLTWQCVSLSTTCSMNVQGVSIPMPTVLTWQRVSLSTTSMNVQSVSIPTTTGPVFLNFYGAQESILSIIFYKKRQPFGKAPTNH